MANLNPLIRVRRHTVEQKQKALSDLYRKAEVLNQEKADLLSALESERTHVQEMDGRMMSYFGPYSEAVNERVQAINTALAHLETHISIAQDEMRRAFSDLKKVEITQERREEEEQKARDKKDSTALDESAIEGYRRKEEEDET